MKSNKQKIIKIKRRVLPDGTHQKTSVGITSSGRLCVTEQKSKKLNKQGDFSISTNRTYRQPTETALNNLNKQGVKIKVVSKGSTKKPATTKKRAPVKKPVARKPIAKVTNSKKRKR